MHKSRFLLLLLPFLVSACSPMPYCYSTSQSQAARDKTASCPAFMCNPGSAQTACVTETAQSRAIKSVSNKSKLQVKPRPVSNTKQRQKTKMENIAQEPFKAAESIVLNNKKPGNFSNDQIRILKAVPGHFYALQVATMSSQDGAEKFVQSLNLLPANIIATSSHIDTVYAVVLGYYPDKAEVIDAGNAFSAEYDLEFWARRVHHLQNAVDSS